MAAQSKCIKYKDSRRGQIRVGIGRKTELKELLARLQGKNK